MPGVTPVKKFMDRKTAVSRIYKAAEGLAVGAQPPAEAPEAKNGDNEPSRAEAAANRLARALTGPSKKTWKTASGGRCCSNWLMNWRTIRAGF